MLFQPKFFRIAQNPLPPSSILNEITYSRDTSKYYRNKLFVKHNLSNEYAYTMRLVTNLSSHLYATFLGVCFFVMVKNKIL